jgi:hypothetical protein
MPMPIKRTDHFHCDRRNKALTVATCLDWYVNANYLNKRHVKTDSPCHKCVQGLRNRKDYSRSAWKGR